MTGAKRGTWIALVAALILMAAQARAISDADRCEAAKNKIAGKYALCREKAEAKAIRTGAAPDFARCDARYGDRWANAEAEAAGTCPTNDDQAPMRSCIAADTSQWAAALGEGPLCEGGWLLATGQSQCDDGTGTLDACPGDPPGQDGAVQAGAARSYTDNGDGTITDNVTRLMWEKLSQDGGIHDFSDAYSWSDAFNVKIAALNSGPGFAGHTDWRLPNVNELHGLVDYGRSAPAIDPAFDTACAPGCTVTTCSCTQSLIYWTSTTVATFHDDPPEAWGVFFTHGELSPREKLPTITLYVRAVRGGS